jgi:hypothetical protein
MMSDVDAIGRRDAHGSMCRICVLGLLWGEAAVNTPCCEVCARAEEMGRQRVYSQHARGAVAPHTNQPATAAIEGGVAERSTGGGRKELLIQACVSPTHASLEKTCRGCERV